MDAEVTIPGFKAPLSLLRPLFETNPPLSVPKHRGTSAYWLGKTYPKEALEVLRTGVQQLRNDRYEIDYLLAEAFIWREVGYSSAAPPRACGNPPDKHSGENRTHY